MNPKPAHIAVAILSAMLILLTGCRAGGTPLIDPTPSPENVTVERAGNSTGARFSFTLEEFTDMLNTALETTNPGDSNVRFSADGWTMLAEYLVDDNGVLYGSYYYVTETVTCTAAAEAESGKLINIGCGCPYEMIFGDDQPYRNPVLIMASLMAVVAGGYNINALDYMYEVFTELLDSRGAVTVGGETLSVDIKEDDTVLFTMTAHVEGREEQI